MTTIKDICKKTVAALGEDFVEAGKALDMSKAALEAICASNRSFNQITNLVLSENKEMERAVEKVVETLNVPSPVLEEAPPMVEENAVVEYKDGILNASFCPAEWGQKKAAWEGRDVCLCLPTYGPIAEEHYFNMLAIVAKYRQAVRIEHRGGDSMIARSRNQLAKRFLRTGATWSIWFDSDMLFPIGNSGVYLTMTNMRHLPEKFAAMSIIERIISHQKTMVGGCYWDRRGTGKLVACGNTPIVAPIPSDNLAPVDFVGTGCLAIHRKVFEDVAQKFPETMSDEALGNETGFFTPIQDERRMKGEDESFAWRAKEAGHPSYLDLGIICGHLGRAIHGMPLTGTRI